MHAPWSPSVSDLFAEQLALAVDLVRGGGAARARMGLVAADNLAEALLYRHVQTTYEASEGLNSRILVPRFDQRARNRARNDFDRRVTLARASYDGPMTFMYPRPILDETRATIFRIARRYRNAVYHEDHHNPALVEPLAWIYLHAVAETAGLTLHAPTIDVRQLADALADDLETRANEARTMWTKIERAGLPSGTHANLLRAAELRAAAHADAKLMALQEEAAQAIADFGERTASAKGGPGDPTQEEVERYRAAEESESQRLKELKIEFKPTLSLGTPQTLERGAARIRQLRDTSRLLSRYELLDERARHLVRCLAWIEREWDRLVSIESDIARGK